NCIGQDDSAFIWVGTNLGLTKLKQRCFSVATKTKLCDGDSMYFDLKKVTSATSTFQWQLNMGAGWSNVSDGGVYSGATTKKLSLNGVGAELDSVIYRCVIKFNSLGYDTSNVDTIFVSLTPNKPTINKIGLQLFTDPATSWQWYFYSGNIPIPGATNQGFTPWLTADHYVEVSNEFGCKSKSDPIAAEGNALANPEIDLKIYPNPSQGKFTISGNTGINNIENISVVNNLGSVIYESKGVNLKGDFTEEINIGNVPGGIYYIKAGTEKGTSVFKLIIEK
ncbi:MAG TPA: T9SS type A sorting domain-containing protein, partial [Candidatus Cloacimonadota bacterium]|nr:T9SS type A sorting domain-containing protein [Candidatus Cloacimonadota bacterium]